VGQACQNSQKKKTTSSSRLDARKVEKGAGALKQLKNHLQLAFGCEGGGGGGSHVKMLILTTSSSCLDMREVVAVGVLLKGQK